MEANTRTLLRSFCFFYSYNQLAVLSDGIFQSIIFAAHAAVTEEDSPIAYALLRCIRAYLDHNMYLSLEVHTDDTIALGRTALWHLDAELHVSLSYFVVQINTLF